MKHRLIAYPFLIAVFPILSIYAHNANETRPAELVIPVAVAIAASILGWWVLRRVLRDGHRAGLVMALALVVFYTVGRTDDVNTALCYAWVFRDYDVQVSEVAAVELPVFAALTYLVVARLKEPRRWTPALNVFAAALVGLPAFTVVETLGHAPARSSLGDIFPTAPATDRRPDIYYIILDGFGRADVLREMYHYDAGPFLDGLRRRGFFVARDSTSNYGQTRLSLASSLNASYLDGVADAETTQDFPLRPLIAENRVARTLKGLGYRFVTFATGYDLTDLSKSDLYLSPLRELGEFQRLLLRSTPLWAFLPDPLERDPYLLARQRTLHALESLPDVAKLRGPTFAFAHIISPHPPFIFGEKGEDVADRSTPFSRADGDAFIGESEGDYVLGYRRQVAFLAKRIMTTIDQILANSAEPPIIILQSDHGPGSGLVHDDREKTNLRERLSILNAYLFPGVAPKGLYDRITPVNSFRVLFNNYFGSKIELLDDRNHISTWSRPFDFMDVSRRLRSEKRREEHGDRPAGIELPADPPAAQ